MKRAFALGAVVLALVVAAVTAWVDVLSEPDRPTKPVAAAVTVFAPPKVLVDPDVDVDKAEVEAYVAHLANDPRGWRADLDHATVRIVRAGTNGTQRMPGHIAMAWPTEHRFTLSDEAWNVLGPKFAAVGGTLDEQRTWVLLHELGHMLGHPHIECPGSGPAPVMRAVSYDLDGCSYNVWPNPQS
jgi:hypothetical protein